MKIEDIREIILSNPNKALIEYGVKYNKKLETLVLGEDLDSFFEQSKYFENKEMFEERKKTTSNRDLFARVLQKEEMVFSARGGSVIYDGITDAQVKKQNAYNDAIRDGVSLRNWMKTVANKAYEVDPHGVIFIEKSIDKNEPYPTYKSIKTIYDYSLNGQKCVYVCFNIEKDQLPAYGVIFKEGYRYFRFVDDVKDYIFEANIGKKEVFELTDKTLIHGFEGCPAFVISDIQDFKDHKKRLSKIYNVEELAASFLNNRSVRDLCIKKFGHQKMVEPLTKCRECKGDGYVNGTDLCKNCNGTGLNPTTKIADSIKLPLEMLADNPAIDMKKIFTYIAPDIETWNKQDEAVKDGETLISDCYWGTDNRKQSQGASKESNLQETATKTMANLQPVYARLSRTAEWAEGLEEMIIFAIAKLNNASLKSVSVKYGRDYILETPYELYEKYLENKRKGSPIYLLNDDLERYLRAVYYENPTELLLALKMMEVEPLVHYTLAEAKNNGFEGDILLAKMYFPEWYAEMANDYLIGTPKEKLKNDLYKYSKGKQEIKNEPEEEKI